MVQKVCFKIKIGKIVNMEKSLKYGEIVSGHYTQGHVDTVGKILNIKIHDRIKLLYNDPWDP